MFYEPQNGHGMPHDPFKAIVAPRPIGWISTRGADGNVNLAPYSFFNAVAGRPPIVMFSSEGDKDTVNLAGDSGQFVCNFPSASLADAINRTSTAVPRGRSEFDLVGLASVPGSVVDVPRLRDVPAALECVVTRIIRQHDRHGRRLDVWTAFGEVVGVHIDDAFIVDGRFDTARADPLARMGYHDYGQLGKVTTIAPPPRSDAIGPTPGKTVKHTW